ncbi:hypothetical protein P5487_013180 [Bacillus amyloliquefaciens]|uniref:hypothetical protein n=1 Tax=Bacillus amyloliquefaciens TaxID=1390 RepID=UPI002453469B|nr:hypothetical protein [Bacillus amyloliquefaciens]MDH3091010.1 hypothetical protein [Bacillus amyloliquefaciens]
MALINHQISMRLETAARKALRLNGRGGLYGVIDADYIDRIGRAFTVLVAAVSPYYREGSVEDKAKIDSFLEKYLYLGDTDTPKEDYSSGVQEAAEELRKLVDELN